MITWKIETLDRRTEDGFVITAHWRAIAQEGEYTASIYATCTWPDGQPTVPYQDLTEQQVLGWCWESGVDKEATEQALTEQLQIQQNPPVTTGVPWANA
jgi:hypothetical protein